MSDGSGRFTSDQRTPREASWVDADDWGAGNAEGVDLVDGDLVFRGPVSGEVVGVMDDFEDAAYDDQGLSLADYYDFSENDTRNSATQPETTSYITRTPTAALAPESEYGLKLERSGDDEESVSFFGTPPGGAMQQQTSFTALVQIERMSTEWSNFNLTWGENDPLEKIRLTVDPGLNWRLSSRTEGSSRTIDQTGDGIPKGIPLEIHADWQSREDITVTVSEFQTGGVVTTLSGSAPVNPGGKIGGAIRAGPDHKNGHCTVYMDRIERDSS